VAEPGALRQYGGVFDGVAAEYDAVRSGYPGELVDAAVATAGLDAGSAILELGCGTGKLTELLVERGLRVDAVEPGANLVEAARRRLGPDAPVRFQIARFEDAERRESSFDAIFSATAFHWIDPDVGWRKAASLLEPEGVLALLTHTEIHDARSDDVTAEFRELLRACAPGATQYGNAPPTLEALMTGAQERSANASDTWDWIMSQGRHGLARAEAAALFQDVAVAALVEREESTTDQSFAMLRTTSLYLMLAPEQREAFERGYRELIERRGGVIRWSRAAVLMTARRSRNA
jgi:SAM-dependent methyltransferase